MTCPEYLRLRQLYEAALRHLGQVLLCAAVNLVGAPARQAAEIKRKAFEERNAAKAVLTAHALKCQSCDPRLRVIRKT
jgi:hypothetical protein